MKNNLQRLFSIVLVCYTFLILSAWAIPSKQKREFYQLTIYHFTTPEQEKTLDNYFQYALVPALHKQGISKVGVFKALANDTVTNKLFYVFIPIESLDKSLKIPEALENDKDYQAAGSAFINTNYLTPAFDRMEKIFLHAFPLAPQMQMPELKSEKNERVYELRSYESVSEKIFKNKVKMFNDGDEIGIFKKLNFNAIFYSEVISGSKMPNLMYMTSFENMDDRNAHWKLFSADPAWKTLSAMPEYLHNVSHSDISFLRPVSYSDF